MLPSRLAYLAPLVEEVLQHLVGLELGGVRLVHGPPEQLVALAAGDEAGFGEAGGEGGMGQRVAPEAEGGPGYEAR